MLDRRIVLIGGSAMIGGLPAVLSRADTPMVEPATKDADKTRTSLHQSWQFGVDPARIYHILLDAKDFAAFSGVPAAIDPAPGGGFSLFDGQITGRNVELIQNQRIVQAWRPGSWPPGRYSIARFELTGGGGKVTVELDHTGFPPGTFGGLDSGWREHYQALLTHYLG